MKPLIQRRTGFTLVELLVSMALLALLLLVLTSITDSTRRTLSYTNSKIEQFREAREAFETMTRQVSQATLNTYLDYQRDATTGKPVSYIRQSELRFISGNTTALTGQVNTPSHAIFFQAPLGYVSDQNYSNIENLLNTWGYFIEFADDSNLRPPFVSQAITPARWRFRLMEMLEPSESMSLYPAELAAGGNSNYKSTTWLTTPLGLNPRPVRVVAENIVALILLPKLTPGDQATGAYTDASLAPTYRYDSTGVGMSTTTDKNLNPINQLPPIIQVTMVAVDETSFNRFQHGSDMPNFDLDKLFLHVGDTTDSSKEGFAKDMKTLTDTLQRNKLSYRVFTSNIAIRSAKWSREQKN